MRGDLAYPSNDQREWLSDVIIANGHAADERPEGDVPVRFNYPRSLAQMPAIFRQRPAQRVLHEQQSCLGQQYCDGIHWHNIALLGPERRAYYWEPKGSSLNARNAIREAFYAAAPPGWTLESIPLSLQADGHSCGDWAHYFRCRLLAYAAEGKLGTNTFPAFLQAKLPNLRLLKGTPLTEAERRQRRLATQRRDALRELLRGAARKGALPWGESQLEDFTPDGTVARPIDVDTLDETAEGDEDFVLL